VDEVLSQPFRLKFETAGGDSGEHIPDFLAVFRDGSRWLLDVRPAGLVKDEDAVRFAVAAEAALEAGWRYLVAGWRPHVLSVLDALSAQRRELEDRLGLEGELLQAVAEGPSSFGDLVAATRVPAVARAQCSSCWGYGSSTGAGLRAFSDSGAPLAGWRPWLRRLANVT
jgi:hypothetical protein